MTDYESQTCKVSFSIQATLTSSNVVINYPATEDAAYTWSEFDSNSGYQPVGIWFEHPLDSTPYEITNIAIVNENLWHIPNLPSGMFSRVSLPIDNPSLQTLNALGGYLALPPTNLQKAVFGRVTELTELAVEDGINMSLLSFLDLWSFISKNPKMRPPSVFALDNGNFRAEWKDQEGELIGLEFCGDELIKFVIFGYARSLGKMMRVAGSQSIGQISDQVKVAFADHLLTN